MFYTILALCLFGSAYGQVVRFGDCPQVQTVANFSVSEFLGRWYEAEKYFAFFEIGGKCITADYSAGENGTIIVVNTQISKRTGKTSSINGTAHAPDPAEPAKLKVKFNGVPFGIEGNYWVLGTDYKSYALVYACTSLKVVHFEFAWILTRDQNPTQSVIDKVDVVINKNNIDRSTFKKTNQTNCNVTSTE